MQTSKLSIQCSNDMDQGQLKQRGADRSDQSTLYADFKAQYPMNKILWTQEHDGDDDDDNDDNDDNDDDDTDDDDTDDER
jgi:hypothetical protein